MICEPAVRRLRRRRRQNQRRARRVRRSNAPKTEPRMIASLLGPLEVAAAAAAEVVAAAAVGEVDVAELEVVLELDEVDVASVLLEDRDVLVGVGELVRVAASERIEFTSEATSVYTGARTEVAAVKSETASERRLSRALVVAIEATAARAARERWERWERLERAMDCAIRQQRPE